MGAIVVHQAENLISHMEDLWDSHQWTAKGASGKGPAERGHVKNRQKSSKGVKNIFDTFRHFSRRAKKRQKSSKSVKNNFGIFRQFSRGTSFPAPFLGGSDLSLGNMLRDSNDGLHPSFPWFSSFPSFPCFSEVSKRGWREGVGDKQTPKKSPKSSPEMCPPSPGGGIGRRVQKRGLNLWHVKDFLAPTPPLSANPCSKPLSFR